MEQWTPGSVKVEKCFHPCSDLLDLSRGDIMQGLRGGVLRVQLQQHHYPIDPYISCTLLLGGGLHEGGSYYCADFHPHLYDLIMLSLYILWGGVRGVCTLVHSVSLFQNFMVQTECSDEVERFCVLWVCVGGEPSESWRSSSYGEEKAAGLKDVVELGGCWRGGGGYLSRGAWERWGSFKMPFSLTRQPLIPSPAHPPFTVWLTASLFCVHPRSGHPLTVDQQKNETGQVLTGLRAKWELVGGCVNWTDLSHFPLFCCSLHPPLPFCRLRLLFVTSSVLSHSPLDPPPLLSARQWVTTCIVSSITRGLISVAHSLSVVRAWSD